MATAPTTSDTPRPYDTGLVQYDFPPPTGQQYDGVYGGPKYDTSTPYDTVLMPGWYYGSEAAYDTPGAYDAVDQL